ncbi:beta-galactosidase [Lichenicoccus sp.]|uniref:beta-galactosidase n=1 Tax=Lichenicoccus sp. TaxID=2781899 RepID=UPI003D151AEC
MTDAPQPPGAALGVCYYPEHWPESWWVEDARQMREAGITYVRIAEFAWSRIEPEPGRFAWDWLDRAIEVLGAAGLRVVMCTPTATPPKWLIDREPGILPVADDGQVRGFGSRRHSSFSSEPWLRETRRITEAVARHCGASPHVAGWQIDNEFGCHDTVRSYGAHDLRAFRLWLRARHGSIGRLNAAWGSVFWSGEFRDFDEVPLPAGAVTETLPAARLDYQRFASDQVAQYCRLQAEILRRHSPGRFVTHNFMGRFVEFDHYAVAETLDFASWDSYPLGFTEQFPLDAAERALFAETAHPDIAAFHHDLYRGVGSGRFWVMEQQPGPVNWAPWNPVPKPGMVRLWTWEAFAHGAEVVSYFRWRQCPFGQEQLHAGLQRPDRSRSAGGEEALRVAGELRAVALAAKPGPAPIALVFDYEAAWMLRIQPQGADFNYLELCLRWYEAARRLGQDVDIVAPGRPLAGYRAVLVPSLPHVSDAALAALRDTKSAMLIGPRTGSRTPDFAIPDTLPPGPLQALLPMRVTQVASLRPGLAHGVTGGLAGAAVRWREWIDTDAEMLARFDDDMPAAIASDRCVYLACWPDRALLDAAVRHVIAAGGGDIVTLPPGVRLRRRGGRRFAFNYGPDAWTLPERAGRRFVLGAATVAPQDLACWDE